LYVYKYTFRLGGILERVQAGPTTAAAGAEAPGVDVQAYIRSNKQSNLRAGHYGFLLLLVGSVLSIGSLSLVVDPSTWDTVDSAFDLFVAPGFLVRYAQFVVIALGAAGIGILYFFFSWKGGVEETANGYGSFVRSVGLRFGVISLLLQPLFILLSLMLLPGVALSSSVFLLVGLCMLSLFATAHFLYAYRRDNSSRFLSYAFAALLLALFFLFSKDQIAISNATRQHAANLAVRYEQDLEELKSRLGIAMVVMSGEDIYNAKCSACHMFDQKKVGPPYREVIPKFEGKKAQLVAFVLNPVKVDPAYPSMPNQGLKPAEADSIATFLLAKYARPSGVPTTTQAPSK
jgi:cytochrome c